MRIMNFANHNLLTKRLCNPADFARQNELMAQLTAARDVLLASV